MADEFDDIFAQHDRHDDAADGGTLPSGAGGGVIVVGPPINAEQFEATFGGLYVHDPVEFEDEDGPGTMRADPRQQAAGEADFAKRLPGIWAAQTLGPADLPANAADAERAERAAKFTAAIAHFKALAVGIENGGDV
jgi:hypothetical protein